MAEHNHGGTADFFQHHGLVDHQWTTTTGTFEHESGALTPSAFFNKSGNVLTPGFESKDYFGTFQLDAHGNGNMMGATSSSLTHFARKRALSSPAITPGASAFVNDNWADFANHGQASPSINEFVPKRPKFTQQLHEESSSLSSVPAIISSGDTSDSPQSVNVLTPPDLDEPVPASHLKQQAPGGRPSTASSSFVNAQQPHAAAIPDLARLADSRRQFAQQAQIEQVNPSAATMPPVAPATFRLQAPAAFEQVMPAVNQPIAQHQVEAEPLDHVAKIEVIDGSFPSVLAPKGSASAAAPAASGKKGKGKAAQGGNGGPRGRKPRKSQPVEDDDEDSKRKAFLERNRLAACKSRQKKKERVTSLEGQAHDLCVRNQQLQSAALSLRHEVLQLRSLLSIHDGCSCEHVAGYLQREMGGGGIPTIHALAGRVFSLDYSNVPTMGSTDDVFGKLAKEVCDVGDFSDDDEGSQMSGHGRRAMTRETASPARASMPANVPPPSTSGGDSTTEGSAAPTRPARVTRSSTLLRQRQEDQMQQTQQQLQQQAAFMRSHLAGSLSPGKTFQLMTPGAMRTGLTPQGLGEHAHDLFAQQQLMHGQEMSRPSSAPASTPGWDKFSPNDPRTDSYFSFVPS